MAESKAQLDNIPPEIRELIFQQLFPDVKINVMRLTNGEYRWTMCRHGIEGMNILYTSKVMYEDARPVLASSINPYFCKIAPSEVQPSIREYYYPRIRNLRIHSGFSFDVVDFSPFAALKEMNILKDSLDCDSIQDFWLPRLPDTSNKRTALKCLEGALDQKLKQMAKTQYLEDSNSMWLRDLLSDQKRRYKILSCIEARWRRSPEGPESITGPHLYLTYDLGSLDTTRRSTFSSFDSGMLNKIWEKGCVRTEVVEAELGSWEVESVKPWKAEEQERLTQDAEMVDLEPESRWVRE